MRAMLVAIAGTASLATTAASAQQAMTLGEQAARCWNIPAVLSESDFVAEFDVILGAHGEVEDIAVVSFAPEGAEARAAVVSASRGIELCAPYDTKQGVVRFTMAAAPMFGEPIDPFAPLDR